MRQKKLRFIRAYVALWGSTAIFCILLLLLLGTIFWRGVPHLTWSLLISEDSILQGTVGILPSIINTIFVIVVSLIIALPIGVGAAIYLSEYARSHIVVSLIEFAAEILAGIPSILYALAGVILFCTGLGLQKTLISASLTLAIMVLPTILRTTQESLKTVPHSYREGALGLGAGKWRMIATVVLPSSISGILTGCILSIGRVVGETAVLLYTAGLSTSMQNFTPSKILRVSGTTLSTALYVHAKERADVDTAFAIAVLLLLLTIAINLTAGLVGKKFSKQDGKSA